MAAVSDLPQRERIAVVGLGYVGLPLALAFAKKFPTLGFDVNQARIDGLAHDVDPTGELARYGGIANTALELSSDPASLVGCTVFIIAVPTPVDSSNRPDLSLLAAASRTVGRALRPGGVVINESTVYPGATEEICAPAIAAESGLARSQYQLAYSPERINPGDHEHTLERAIKVVAAQDPETLDRVADLYAAIVPAGIHRAPSIPVAEAAKVLENTQRDLNIALMNEMAILFDKLGIATRDVLAAAGTKWNFLPFTPGLVGGHCIGVDPYYLTHKAEQVGYHPEVILAGRRINDGMGRWVANRLVRELARMGRHVLGARVGVLGLAYKPDVADSRSSRVPDIVKELEDFGVAPLVHDPLVDHAEVESHYGISLVELDQLHDLDALILAVPHKWYAEHGHAQLFTRMRGEGLVFDVKGVLDRAILPAGARYLSL